MTLATIIATTMALSAINKSITLSATTLIAISVITTLNAVCKHLLTVITMDAIIAILPMTTTALCRKITATATMITTAIVAMIILIALSPVPLTGMRPQTLAIRVLKAMANGLSHKLIVAISTMLLETTIATSGHLMTIIVMILIQQKQNAMNSGYMNLALETSSRMLLKILSSETGTSPTDLIALLGLTLKISLTSLKTTLRILLKFLEPHGITPLLGSSSTQLML